jgi:hypothetical protein
MEIRRGEFNGTQKIETKRTLSAIAERLVDCQFTGHDSSAPTISGRDSARCDLHIDYNPSAYECKRRSVAGNFGICRPSFAAWRKR